MPEGRYIKQHTHTQKQPPNQKTRVSKITPGRFGDRQNMAEFNLTLNLKTNEATKLDTNIIRLGPKALELQYQSSSIVLESQSGRQLPEPKGGPCAGLGKICGPCFAARATGTRSHLAPKCSFQ